jgi:hypothetical protein
MQAASSVALTQYNLGPPKIEVPAADHPDTYELCKLLTAVAIL